MRITRYITVQAIKTRENELIPIWDENVIYEKSDDFGEYVSLKNGFTKQCFYFVECLFDLKTKELKPGVVLNHYPNEKSIEFKVGQEVYFEKENRKLVKSKIKEIVFEDFDTEIMKGKKIDKWILSNFKDTKIDDKTIYCIKYWKPYYILENDEKIEWSHKLYHKYE